MGLGIGDVVLGATLKELVGRGPNGAVFKAIDAGGRTLAVKAFDPEGAAESDAETFKRGTEMLGRVASLEGGAAARLVRPIAVEPSGLAFAYDHYDNGNLAGVPSLGWDVPRIVAFFSAICRSVRELHALGLVHRALKPTNVLVDDDLQPVLADAGMHALPDSKKTLTAADAIYSAPEELARETTVGSTADVYGLGRLLWFLLAGRDPDDSTDELAAFEAQQKYPVGLLRIIRKATAYDPALRYQKVEELESELARYDGPDPVGIGAEEVDESQRGYRLSSLPEEVPLRPELRTAPEPAVERDAAPARALPRALELAVASAGVLAVLSVGVMLAMTPAPSTNTAQLFGGVAAAGLSLATFFLPSYRQRPLVFRFAVLAGVFCLLSALELERMATLRWRMTVESGSPADRAAAVRALSRRGAKDFGRADLSKLDLLGADLGSVNFSGANLTGANLSGANLAEADLTGARLTGANLRRADLATSQVEKAVGLATAHCDGFTIFPSGWICKDGRPMTERLARD